MYVFVVTGFVTLEVP